MDLVIEFKKKKMLM